MQILQIEFFLESLNISEYDHIIILCYMNGLDIQESDAKTLICLLHLRDISNKSGKPISIVSEMLDQKNKTLAEITKADDFIVSDKIISLMLSQLSENKELKKVYDILFSAEGSEVYLRPVTEYVKTGEQLNFHTVIESASRKNQVAVGYRLDTFSKNPFKAYGVVFNPIKSDLITFQPEDKIIVLSDD